MPSYRVYLFKFPPADINSSLLPEWSVGYLFRGTLEFKKMQVRQQHIFEENRITDNGEKSSTCFVKVEDFWVM